MAQNATERLKPFGRTIDDAVDYVAYLEASARSITVAERVPQLIAAEETDGLSTRLRQSPLRRTTRSSLLMKWRGER
jgi:hypothetical protein